MPALLARVYTRARLGPRLAADAGSNRRERLSLMEHLGSAAANLTSPAVLFFFMGMFAGAARSELNLPDQAAKTLSLYLMLAIGFKGGAAARTAGMDPQFLLLGAAGLLLSFAIPFIAFALLRGISKLDRVTAAATAAHYGSVSIVTFAAGAEYLSAMGVSFDGFMAAVLALMETPAILAALIIVGRSKESTEPAHRKSDLVREVFLNGATVMLVGAFVVGAISGPTGLAKLDVFVNPLFQGALCLFLLDMGLVAARQLRNANQIEVRLLAFALIFPVAAGIAGALLARMVGADFGNGVLFAILAASASYIAVPAAMRISMPKADAGVYLTLSMGVTFPFNLVIGVPMYLIIATGIWS